MSAALFGLSWCFLAWALLLTAFLVHDTLYVTGTGDGSRDWLRFLFIGLLYGLSAACWQMFTTWGAR